MDDDSREPRLFVQTFCRLPGTLFEYEYSEYLVRVLVPCLPYLYSCITGSTQETGASSTLLYDGLLVPVLPHVCLDTFSSWRYLTFCPCCLAVVDYIESALGTRIYALNSTRPGIKIIPVALILSPLRGVVRCFSSARDVL
jgi:hypothetical protein